MPEFWELCDHKSKAVLMQLYWNEQGCLPDFYYELTSPKKPVINAPDYEELEEMEIERELRKPPSHQERHD